MVMNSEEPGHSFFINYQSGQHRRQTTLVPLKSCNTLLVINTLDDEGINVSETAFINYV